MYMLNLYFLNDVSGTIATCLQDSFRKFDTYSSNICDEGCTYCGIIYVARLRYWTNYLKRHISTYIRKDTLSAGQLFVGQNSMSSCGSSFGDEAFRNLLTDAIIMHDLPLQFAEWDGME